ncbi:MAG: tRNA lysidine(34) synthetase TilS [Verrucomicrobiota bacterium]
MSSHDELNDAFAASLKGWMPKSSPYLVAVSGGLDSVVLLHFLHRFGYEALTVCHVDHQIRGDESGADAEWVEEAAAKLGLECELALVDVPTHAAAKKCSLELAARELRYAALEELARKHHCPRVVTAHHADDQVETVLINFFRGSGSRGLCGMERVSERESGWNLYRPFLPIRREELENYARRNGLEFRQDPSNFEDFALRNRVRNRLLPMLNEVFERPVSGAVLRAAELAAMDERWIEEALGELPVREEGLDVSVLRDMTEGRRNRILLQWLRKKEIPNCGREEVARISEILLRDENPSKVNLPGGHHARRRSGVLFLEKGGEVI